MSQGALTPNDVVTIYILLAPVILCAIVIYLLFQQRPQVNVHFPKILLCGQVDDIGTTVHVAGQKNGALIVAGRKLKPNSLVYLIEVGNA